MPKPLAGVQGSGMHTHLSLWEGEHNAFVDPDDPYGLSAVAYRFIAGLLHHAREITAVTNQWVNSYKRLVSGYEAPVHIGWARNNRSALVRVPVVKHGKVESTRLEYRAPDSACNPYLAFAVILAAGLRGIEEGYELPPEADANLFSPLARPSWPPRASSPCPAASTTRSTRWSAPSCWPTPSASTSSSGSSATSGPSGRRTSPRSPSSSSTATCPRCDDPAE